MDNENNNLNNYISNENQINTNNSNAEKLKKIKKQDRKLVHKAANMIGTIYFILMGFLYIITIYAMIPFFAVLNIPVSVLTLISNVFYIFLPFLCALILRGTSMKRISMFVSANNYKRVRNIVIQQLIILGFFYCVITFNLFSSLTIISYVLSSVFIVESLKKASNIN